MKKRITFAVMFLLVAGCARNLANQLVSPDEKVRQAALKSLENADLRRRKEVIPHLIAPLGSENGNLRRRAVQALVRLDQDAVNPLVRALQSPNHRTRAAAAETLGLIGPSAKSAVGPLVEAEQDKEGDVRLWAVVSLNRLKECMTDTERQLFQLLYGKRELSATKAAAKAALPAGDPRALVASLKDRSVKGRTQAVLALVQKGPLAVPALLTALADPDETVRDGAAEALRLLTQDQADVDQALVSFLKEGDAASRAAHDRAFASLDRDAPDAAPALAALLDHESLCVRIEAVRSLGALGARTAAPVLKKAADDPNPLVRQAALRSLRRLRRAAPTAEQKALVAPLNAVWAEMLAGLARGEVEKALGSFVETQRDEYRIAFLSLGDTLPSVAKSLASDLSFQEAFGERFVTLEGRAFIEGVEQTIQVRFVRDEKGEWKVRGF